MKAKKRILIIDDEVEVAEVLSHLLGQSGLYIINIAHTAAGGIISSISWQPDLIILDLTLSDMNGWECFKTLQENLETKNIPIIISSLNSTTLVDKPLGLSAETLQYFMRPYDVKEILALMEHALNVANQ
jgi:DNA-binding response OmpR family regulator